MGVVKDKFRNMTNIPYTKESESLKSTLNQEEHDKFKKMADDWWDPKGPAQGLLSMNQLRVPLIKDGLISICGRVKYLCSTIESFLEENSDIEKFDAVIASEVIEHVDNPPHFVSTCSSLIDEGGSFFLTTINRT